MPTIQLGYGSNSIGFDYDGARLDVLAPDEGASHPLSDGEIAAALDAARLFPQVPANLLLHRPARERRLAGQEEVHHGPEAVEVAPVVRGSRVVRLLGGDIVRRAE